MKSFYYIIIFTFLANFYLGCNPKKANIEHPTQSNIPDKGASTTTILNQEITIPNLQEIFSGITDYEIETIVGEEYGEPHEMFGFIADAEMDRLNNLYILDDRRQNVKLFDSNGEFITFITRKGAGPGELEFAKNISIYEDWLLIDNYYSVEVFDVSKDSIHLEKTVSLDLPLISSCVIGNTFFSVSTKIPEGFEADGQNSYPIIHAYSLPDFKHLFSFGESYKSAFLPIVTQLSLGSISCNPKSETVIFNYDRLPYLYGYSAKDGSKKWSVIMSDLQQPKVVQTMENGRIGLGFLQNENIYRDNIMKAVSISEAYSLIQVDRRFVPLDGNYISDTEVISYIVDTSTGRASHLTNDLPRILHFGINNRSMTVDSDYSIGKILTH